ncbi:MAG: hypothetical protein WAQ99_09295 [Pyrinomonadaceae bacterium]
MLWHPKNQNLNHSVAPASDTPIEQRLRQFMHERAPLGPCDAAEITDPEVAARLFDYNISYRALLHKDVNVLLGRRGSGKTTLVNTHKYTPYLEPNEYRERVGAAAASRRSEIFKISTPEKFDELQRRVISDKLESRPIEGLVDDWENVVINYLLCSLCERAPRTRQESTQLKLFKRYLLQDETEYANQVREEIQGRSLWRRLRSSWWVRSSTYSEHLSRERIMTAVEEYLKNDKVQAVILFDSMDEHPVGNLVFDRTIAALLQLVPRFNTRYQWVRIKVVLPAEIFPEIQKASAYPLRDLLKFDHVQWSASSLAKMAAHRYQLFLSLFDPSWDEAVTADLSQPDELRHFWTSVLPPTVANRYQVEEESLLYILRHTQLLPRQFLRILELVIVDSYALTGGYRSLDHEVIRTSIEKIEGVIAAEVFSAFRYVYPFAETIQRTVFKNYPVVFSYEELETRLRRCTRKYHQIGVNFDISDFSEMSIRMGIMGIVTPGRKSDGYYRASFAYQSLVPFKAKSGQVLCLHPIFDRYLNAARPPEPKAILAADVTLNL